MLLDLSEFKWEKMEAWLPDLNSDLNFAMRSIDNSVNDLEAYLFGLLLDVLPFR